MSDIGDMDQIVSLQSVAETNNEGSLSQEWTEVAQVWAYIVSQRGSVAFEAAKNNARETIRIMLHYRHDVATSWRVVWEGQNYNITAVDRSQRRTHGKLWLTAEVIGAV